MILKLVFAILIAVWANLSVAEIKVMTLNAEWLWTPYDGKADGKKFNKGDMKKTEYLAEIAFYSQLVRSNDVDLLAISEVENQFVAQDLARKLGKGWEAHFVQGRDTATGQDVALVSRLALVNGSLTNFGFPCGKAPRASKKKCLSKVIGASFKVDGKGNELVSVISSHFLSKRNDSKKKRLKRQGQAYALVNAIKSSEKQFKGKSTVKQIVLGDFNDTYNSEVLKILRKQGKLKGTLDCPWKGEAIKQQRLKSIDHILYRGFKCLSEYHVSTGRYSDHDAVIAVLK